MGTVRYLLLRISNAASNSLRLFSSSSAAAAIRRPWVLSSDEPECSELDEESDVYKRALKTQRPTTVEFKNIVGKYNRASFIGTIAYPPIIYDCKNFHTYTSLNVKASNGGYSHFRVFLKFFGEMGKMSLHYLKPDHLIFVSGRPESYTGKNEIGKPKICYKVIVSEFNFVVQHREDSLSQKHMKRESKLSREDILKKHRDRLHLWHIFFASPDEWWDNRHEKQYPTTPDFKHKDTGEKLWLKNTDPPWIEQQLDVLDSRLGKRSSMGARNARLNLSPMSYNDPEGT